MVGSVGFGLLQLGLHPGVAAFVLSVIPFLGLREAMAVSSFIGFSFGTTLIIPMLGSVVATLFALVVTRYIFVFIHNYRRPTYFIRSLRRSFIPNKSYSKRLYVVLFAIATIPIPFTGPWLCATASTALDMPVVKSFVIISAGTALSALLMLVIALVLPGSFGIFV